MQHHLLRTRSILIEERVRVGMDIEVDDTPTMPTKGRKRCDAEDTGPEAEHERVVEVRKRCPSLTVGSQWWCGK